MLKFETVELPWLLKLYRAAWRPAARLRQQVLQMPLRWLFTLLYKAGAGGRGRIRLGAREIEFDARNLQFVSVYMAGDAPEPDDVEAILERLLAPGKVFYDVGANWGHHSLLADARGAVVHAFEPMPSTARDLRAAAAGTGVVVHELALGEADAAARMSIPDGMHSGLASIGEAGVEVKVARLDGLGLPPPDVVKLDVEGHELPALKGMRQTLQKARPVIVFESWEGPATYAVFEFLKGLGYRFSVARWNAGKLELVDIEPAQRALLKAQVNVVASPA
jgi:FkbM family methyltransferase